MSTWYTLLLLLLLLMQEHNVAASAAAAQGFWAQLNRTRLASVLQVYAGTMYFNCLALRSSSASTTTENPNRKPLRFSVSFDFYFFFSPSPLSCVPPRLAARGEAAANDPRVLHADIEAVRPCVQLPRGCWRLVQGHQTGKTTTSTAFLRLRLRSRRR